MGRKFQDFKKISFINKCLTSKFPTFDFHLSITIVHEILVWALFWVNFRLMTSPRWVKTSKSLIELFHKRVIPLKVPFTFDFYLSINIVTWNINLDIFDPLLGWWRHRGKSKLQILGYWFEKRLLHLKFLFSIDFHLSITTGTWNTTLGLFWPDFWLMMSPPESKLQYFDKVISETNSSL